LGACLGHCPQGAITIDVREAVPYNETKVMDYIIKGGPNVIKAHLEHLVDHNEMEYFQEAVEYLKINGIKNPVSEKIRLTEQKHSACGCPGSKEISFAIDEEIVEGETGKRISYLTQWPIQFHLVSPYANYYQNSHLFHSLIRIITKIFLKIKVLPLLVPNLILTSKFILIN